MKQAFTIILCLLLLTSYAYAFESYNTTGGKNQLFRVGQGIFNEQITTDLLESVSLNTQRSIPMVADLDGDGTQEIVIVDGSNTRIFQGTDLQIVDSFSHGVDEVISNVELFDIDNDGKVEIIFAREQSEVLEILEFNGSVFTNQSSIPLSSLDHSDGGMMIKCGKTDNCLLIFNPLDASTLGADAFGVGFDRDSIGTPTSIFSSGASTEVLCLPKIREISYKDIDNDGTDEYIFTMGRFRSNGDDFLHINIVTVTDGTLAVTEELEATFDQLGFLRDINPHTSGSPVCSSQFDLGGVIYHLEDFVSSPLVFDFDSSAGNGLEVVVGMAINNDEFVMAIFGSSLNFIDDFPEIFNANGQMISNPMIANIYGDTGEVDFCVLGFQQQLGVIDLVCASEQTGQTPETQEYQFRINGTFNISKEFRNLAIISHMGDYSEVQVNVGEGNVDTTDLLNAYGTFRISSDFFEGAVVIRDLERIYANPIGLEVSCIAVDVEKTGSEDIICAETTRLYYIDDGLSNQPAEITEVSFNPCIIDSIIKVNTTLQILVTVTDQNSVVLGQDLVSSRVSIYNGLPNEQNEEVGNTTSGAIHPYSFNLNLSTIGASIRIEGYDIENPNSIDVETFTLSVADNGLEFGESECTQSFITTAEEQVLVTQLTDIDGNQLNNNTFNRGVVELSNVIGVGAGIVWILLMLFVGIAFFVTPEIIRQKGGTFNINFNMLGAIVFFFEGLMIVIGSKLGILGIGVIIVLTVLLLIAVGIWVGRLFTGQGTTM